MSKKCPHCGSYNTEISVGNYAERTVINAGRALLAGGAAILGQAVHPGSGSHLGVHTWKNTDPGELKGHHCCNCGKDFSA